MSAAQTMIDHDDIRQWIEDRGGRPAIVKATEHDGKGEGILRVDFQDGGNKLDDVEWDEFFKVFDDNNLAFLHQDETADGSESRFNKFVAREG